MANELEPIVKLGQRLRDETKGMGVELVKFSIDPNLDSDVHQATAMFIVDEENPSVTNEVDPEFEALIEGQIKAEREAKAAKAREDMESLAKDLKDPSKGLGFDD